MRLGLTGWAQIHGRDELEIAEKAKLDGWYVEHISFGLDVKCFFGTITAVLRHDGVVEGGTGTLRMKNDHYMETPEPWPTLRCLHFTKAQHRAAEIGISLDLSLKSV